MPSHLAGARAQLDALLEAAEKRKVDLVTVSWADLEKSVIKVLKGVDGIATMTLNETDVVRHPLVKRIIRAYDQWDAKG